MHDLRNQLMIMRLSATNILDGDQHGRARRLDQLQQSVERAALLINALLLNEQAVLPGRRPFDANEVIRRTAATLSHGPLDPVRVELDLWPEPLPVITEVGDLDRLLLNLVLNAFDAMPDGGVLTIETTVDQVPESSEAGPSGAYVRLTVTDTGCGMTAEVKDRIFDAFFTTKKGGTGLGLRSVAFTVQQLQGTDLRRQRTGTRHFGDAPVPARPGELYPELLRPSGRFGRLIEPLTSSSLSGIA